MSRPKLTESQERIFRFMANYFAKHQRMPTFREIGAEAGISSPNGVLCHLEAIARKGYLVWERGNQATGKKATARGYEIAGLSEAIAPIVADHVKRMLEGA